VTTTRQSALRSFGRRKPAPTCGPSTGFRLRCGDYRLFFDLKDENKLDVTGVRNRREAYR
jgi:mRNA-degrading endonuclease RelE of RelBE toxin-antitoxin system